MRFIMLASCWFGIVGFLGCNGHQHGENSSISILQKNNLSQVIVCTPQRPIVGLDEEVELRVWLEEDGKPELTYRWQAQAGQITPNGRQAMWDLTGVKKGVYRSEVTVQSSDEMNAACSITVVVDSGVRAFTGRSFLVRTHEEDKNYGLYSYLLLGAKPTDETVRKRHLEAIRAYLSLDTINDLENVFPRQKLNITYLPLKNPPMPSESAGSLLTNYDYPRAKLLLSNIPGDHMDGPYLVSSLEPLSGSLQQTGHYLFQDLSWVPADSDLLGLWIREFLLLTSQERFGEEATARQLVLKMRTLIRVAALGLPEVKTAVDQWIRWISEG